MLRLGLRSAVFVLIFILPAHLTASGSTESCRISGRILDPQLAPVSGANLTLANVAGALIRQTKSDQQGKFVFEDIDAGEYQLTGEAASFVPVVLNVSIAAGREKEITLQFKQVVSILQSITVVASSPSLLTPDPAQTIVIHDQVLDANPGRPGAPISIPGLPIETASGGIKAPQYFAPGVAGDHGEPIAQFFQSEAFSTPTTCLRMRTAMVTPIRISWFHLRSKRWLWTAERSTYVKETTRWILRRRTFLRSA
jgi:hypothetical protein